MNQSLIDSIGLYVDSIVYGFWFSEWHSWSIKPGHHTVAIL